MTARIPRLAFAVALLFAITAGTAAAAVGGDPLRLGLNNTIDQNTQLTGAAVERMFTILNNGTGRALGLFSSSPLATLFVNNTSGGPGIQIAVKSGSVPITVNGAAGKATNLDVDKLDGLDSSDLQRRVSGACAVGATIQAINADGSVGCASFMGIRNYERRMTTDGSANASNTCPEGDLCFAGGFTCDTGDTLLSGGFDSIDNGTRLVASEPFIPNPTDTWRIKFVNNGTEDTIVVITLCADNAPFRP